MEKGQAFTIKILEDKENPNANTVFLLSSSKRNKKIAVFWKRELLDLLLKGGDNKLEALIDDRTALLKNVAKVMDQGGEISAGDIFIDIQDDDKLRPDTPWEVCIQGDQTLEGDTVLLAAFCSENIAEYYLEQIKGSEVVEEIKIKMFSHEEDVFTVGHDKFIQKKEWERKFPHLKEYLAQLQGSSLKK